MMNRKITKNLHLILRTIMLTLIVIVIIMNENILTGKITNDKNPSPNKKIKGTMKKKP